jgi:hypothetical protein
MILGNEENPSIVSSMNFIDKFSDDILCSIDANLSIGESEIYFNRSIQQKIKSYKFRAIGRLN